MTHINYYNNQTLLFYINNTYLIVLSVRPSLFGIESSYFFHNFNQMWNIQEKLVCVSNESIVSQTPWELPADWSKGIVYHILN